MSILFHNCEGATVLGNEFVGGTRAVNYATALQAAVIMGNRATGMAVQPFPNDANVIDSVVMGNSGQAGFFELGEWGDLQNPTAPTRADATSRTNGAAKSQFVGRFNTGASVAGITEP